MGIKTSLGDVRWLDAEVVVAGLYEDERPPQGLAGKVDWYLFGLLTEMLAQGRFSGERGTLALLETASRIASPRFMLVGLGRRDTLDAAAMEEVLNAFVGALEGLGTEKALVEVLGGRGAPVGQETASRGLVSALGDPALGEGEFTILAADEAEQDLLGRILW